MLESVLVANRGEIAVRIVRACRDAGIRSIAVYSDADAEAEHVVLADQAVHLGPSALDQSYLDMDRLLAAAKRTEAAAVHPGYGLLSENGEFADRVTAAGLVFVGPPGHVIELLGDKRSARAQAAAVGLPVLPARTLDGHRLDDAPAEAAHVGYPLLVKAAFGGGGRGMRIVRTPDELMSALDRAQRENQQAFGRSDVYLERFLPNARHVEVQILADQHGTVRHLGTRDCTTQRRNQKLIEEAPALDLPADVTARTLAGSARLATAVGYHGAATVEFLVGPDAGELYFLEVNTRVQVEHTVTEAITGIDIVAAQLAIAGGDPIPFAQEDVVLRGHAIEARINAEDPSDRFYPQAGTIRRLHLPAGPWVRVDAGVAAGATVSPFYDSLLAKVTAWGADRETARRRLVRALREVEVDGLSTTAKFLGRVLEDERFRAGTHWTAMIDDGVIDTAGLADRLRPSAVAPAGASASAPPYRSTRIRTATGEIALDVVLAVSPTRLAGRTGESSARSDQDSATGYGSVGGVAPMDAVLVHHAVTVGDRVEPATTVAVVESMKMETHVAAGTAGTVVALHAAPGESVKRGQKLVSVEVAG